jgi:hypothetical protein
VADNRWLKHVPEWMPPGRTGRERQRVRGMKGIHDEMTERDVEEGQWLDGEEWR